MAIRFTPSGPQSFQPRSPFRPRPSSSTGSSGGGGGSSSRPSAPTVRFGKPGEIFINGKGFSVPPENQARFIQQRGGVVNQQVQKQIASQRKIFEDRIKKQEALRIEREKQRKLLEQKRILKNQLINERNEQRRRALITQSLQNQELIIAKASAKRFDAGIISGFRNKVFEQAGIKGGVLKNKQDARKVINIIDKQLGKKFTNGKKPFVLGPITDEKFTDIKPRLRIRLQNFIINKIPGGRTIVRKLKDASLSLKQIEKEFPVVEDFLSASEKKRRRMLSDGFVVEVKKDFPEFAKGTKVGVKGFRKATFEEKLGLKKDKDTASLKLQVELIQGEFGLNRITEKVAEKRFNLALSNFLTKKAKQRIPLNIALGAGLVALQSIPGLGQAITAGFVTTAILNRRKIVSQFKNFPKASAIETASFLVGGLVGSVIKGSVKGRFNKNIDPKKLNSISGVTGSERLKAIRQAQQLDNGLRVSIKQRRITGLSVYDIKMKDGRLYRVVEFSKLTLNDVKKGLKGEKGLIGFQLLKARGEKFFGRGVSVVVDGKSKTFLRILRFKPAKSKLGRGIQKLGFKKGKIINVLEKSKIIFKKGKVTKVLSRAKILSIKKVNLKLGRLINKLEKKIKLNKKISLADFKQLINLERRNNGLRPFTNAEFKSAKFPTITNTIVAKFIKRGKIVVQKNNNLIRISADVKSGIGGISRTRPFKLKKIKTKGKIKRPISKLIITAQKKAVKPIQFQNKINTLTRLSLKLDRAKSVSGQSLRSQLKSINNQVKNLKSRLTGSPGAITLALATDLERSIHKATIPGAVLGLTIRSIWEGVGSLLSNNELAFYSKVKGNKLRIEQRWIVSNLPKISLKIKTKQKILQITRKKIKQRVRTGQRNQLKIKIKQTNKQLQGLKQLQKIGQKLKQKLKFKGTGKVGRFGLTPPKVPTKKIPIIIPGLKGKGFKPKTLPKKVPVFFIKVKKKGKIVKLSPRPLTLRDARDFLAYEMDHTLIRSAWFEPIGRSKNVLKVPKRMKGYFNKIKKKLRPFKIRVGRKKSIRNGFIERKKYVGDTRSEIKQLQTSRKKSVRRKPVRRKVKKRVVKRKPTKRRSTKKKQVKSKPAKRKRIKKKEQKRKSPKRKTKNKKQIKRKNIKRRKRK